MSDKAAEVHIEAESMSSMICCNEACKAEIDITGKAQFSEIECPACKTKNDVPARFGNFTLLKLLGTGGMGGVYKAKDDSLNRLVAIKVMLKSFGEDPKFVENFKREAQAAAKLNNPNICQIYQVGEEKGQTYIVMELVSGYRLDKIMEGNAKVDQALVAYTGKCIAEGLNAANDIGLVHGDIKPENILYDEKLQPKLVDFGIASFANQQSEGIWGTPYYIAPEKIKKHKTDCRTDMYSLGATLYHALAGRPPFEGQTPIEVVKARLTKPPEPIRTYRTDIKPDLEEVIMRMLQQSPMKRHPTYNSLISDLNKVLTKMGGFKAMSYLGGKDGSGRMMISKKSSAISTGEVADIPLKDPATQGRTRVSVKKPATLVKPSVPADPNDPMAKYRNKLMNTGSQTKTPEQKKKNTIIFTLVAATLLIAGVGGGIYFHFSSKDKEAQARRYEKNAMEKCKKRADTSYGQIAALASNISVHAVKAEKNMAIMTNAYFVLSNVSYVQPVIEAPKPVATVTNAAANTASTTNKADKAAKPKDAPPPPELVASDDAPPGEMSAAQLEAMRNKAAAAAPAQTNAPANPPQPAAAAAVAAPAEPPPAPEPPKEEAEIKKLADEFAKKNNEIKNRLNIAVAAQTEAYEIWKQVYSSSNSIAASALIPKITEKLPSLEGMESNIKEVVIAMEKPLKKAKDLLEAETKKKEEARIAAEAESKRLAEEQAKQQKEAELAAKVQVEMGSVDAIVAENAAFIKSYQYDTALKALGQRMKTLETEKAKQALAITTNKYSRLVGLQTHIIDYLGKNPYNWGWTDPRSKQTEDIVSADKNGVKLRTRTVSWGEVLPAQMLKIIRFCVSDIKKLQIKQLKEQNLAAAIFCHEQGAHQIEKEFVDKAANFGGSEARTTAIDLGLLNKCPAPVAPEPKAPAATAPAPEAVPGTAPAEVNPAEPAKPDKKGKKPAADPKKKK